MSGRAGRNGIRQPAPSSGMLGMGQVIMQKHNCPFTVNIKSPRQNTKDVYLFPLCFLKEQTMAEMSREMCAVVNGFRGLWRKRILGTLRKLALFGVTSLGLA